MLGRLPTAFPLVDRGGACRASAEALFACVDRSGAQREGTREASAVHARVWAECGKEIEVYRACMGKVRADSSLKLVRAPQAYLDQLASKAP